jgi:hypothetical protein
VLAVRTEYIYRNLNEQLDENESVQSYPIPIGESVANGTVVAVSDSIMFINSVSESSENPIFIQNIITQSTTITLYYFDTISYDMLR